MVDPIRYPQGVGSGGRPIGDDVVVDTGPVARHLSPDPVFTVLFVCTGNICRSAMAERMARAFLDEALGDDAHRIQVVSAGTQAVKGAGVHPDSATVLEGFGGDPAGHVAQQLLDDMAIDADLTLALTRSHRRAVLKAAPRALQRTFTVREAAELAALVPAAVVLEGDDLAERCRALVKKMAGARSRRPTDAGDDIADPIGRPLEVHQEVADVIAESLIPLLTRLATLRPAAAGEEPDEGDGKPHLYLVS